MNTLPMHNSALKKLLTVDFYFSHFFILDKWFLPLTRDYLYIRHTYVSESSYNAKSLHAQRKQEGKDA